MLLPLIGWRSSVAAMKPRRVPSAARTSLLEPGSRGLKAEIGGAEAAVENAQPTTESPASPKTHAATRRPRRALLRGLPWPRRRRRLRWERLISRGRGARPQCRRGSASPRRLGTLQQALRAQAPQAARPQLGLARTALP